MIRIILAGAFVNLFLLVSYILFFIEWIWGKFNRTSKDYSCLRIVQWAFRVVLKISGVTVTVIGEENIPDEPTLFIGNHRSIFDILILYIRCKRLTGFIAKDSIEKVPSLRVWMRHLYCLFLNRKDPRSGMKIVLDAIEHIKNGISICVFPEGTRNKDEELTLLPFKEGTMKIATKTGCPIVPVSLNNTASIFENQFPKIRKTHVVVEYGKPIYPNELDKDQQKHLGATCQEQIEKMLQKNAQLLTRYK